jgi:hypothetical protein
MRDLIRIMGWREKDDRKLTSFAAAFVESGAASEFGCGGAAVGAIGGSGAVGVGGGVSVAQYGVGGFVGE